MNIPSSHMTSVAAISEILFTHSLSYLFKSFAWVGDSFLGITAQLEGFMTQHINPWEMLLQNKSLYIKNHIYYSVKDSIELHVSYPILLWPDLSFVFSLV